MTTTILIHGVETTPAEFWASLPEADAIALVKAAPRVANPWHRTNTGAWVRGYNDVNDMPYDSAAVICPAPPGQWHWYSPTGMLTFGSPEEAKAAADAHLRANGWLLESEAAE